MRLNHSRNFYTTIPITDQNDENYGAFVWSNCFTNKSYGLKPDTNLNLLKNDTAQFTLGSPTQITGSLSTTGEIYDNNGVIQKAGDFLFGGPDLYEYFTHDARIDGVNADWHIGYTSFSLYTNCSVRGNLVFTPNDVDVVLGWTQNEIISFKDSTGEKLWTLNKDEQDHINKDNPVVSYNHIRGVVYYNSYFYILRSSGFYCYDTDGDLKWSIDCDNFKYLKQMNDTIYIYGTMSVAKIDLSEKKIAWKSDITNKITGILGTPDKKFTFVTIEATGLQPDGKFPSFYTGSPYTGLYILDDKTGVIVHTKTSGASVYSGYDSALTYYTLYSNFTLIGNDSDGVIVKYYVYKESKNTSGYWDYKSYGVVAKILTNYDKDTEKPENNFTVAWNTGDMINTNVNIYTVFSGTKTIDFENALKNNILYLGSSGTVLLTTGSVYCINTSSGSVTWNVDVSTSNGYIMPDFDILLGTGSSMSTMYWTRYDKSSGNAKTTARKIPLWYIKGFTSDGKIISGSANAYYNVLDFNSSTYATDAGTNIPCVNSGNMVVNPYNNQIYSNTFGLDN
jgi:hypothetical protein